jgi:DNA-binding Lrp family transcriptional regulator
MKLSEIRRKRKLRSELIVTNYEEMRIKEIANLLGVHQSRICILALEAGLTKRKRLSAVEENYLRFRLYKAELSIIAISLGVSVATLNRSIRKLGLAVRGTIIDEIAYDFIHENYHYNSVKELANLMDISEACVTIVINELEKIGLIERINTEMKWSAVELDYLKERYPEGNVEIMATTLNRSLLGLIKKARQIKIKRIKRYSPSQRYFKRNPNDF